MANIVYRKSSTPAVNPTTVNKGAPLTKDEVDGNFIGINTELSTLGSSISSIEGDIDTINSSISGISSSLTSKLDVAGDTLTGRLELTSYSLARINHVGVSGTVTLDLSLSNVFYIVPSADISIILTNLVSGAATTVSIHIVGGGTYNITWPSSWKWNGGIAPTLGTGTTLDLIVAQIADGTNWRAAKVQTHSV